MEAEDYLELMCNLWLWLVINLWWPGAYVMYVCSFDAYGIYKGDDG